MFQVGSADQVSSKPIPLPLVQDDSGTVLSACQLSEVYMTPKSSPPSSSPALTHPPLFLIRERVMVADADSGRKHTTFFSALPAKFEDMELLEGDLIPAQPFLYRCQLLLPFFGEAVHMPICCYLLLSCLFCFCSFSCESRQATQHSLCSSEDGRQWQHHSKQVFHGKGISVCQEWVEHTLSVDVCPSTSPVIASCSEM